MIDFTSFDIIILDNTAFVSSLDINLIANQHPDLEIYVSDLIFEEAEKNYRAKNILETALEQRNLLIGAPSSTTMKIIKQAAAKSGDLKALSEPDQSILALAYELRDENPGKNIMLITDDYSVQNTATFVSPPIPTMELSKDGIKKPIQWEVYCPGCFKKYAAEKLGSSCPTCQVELKRRKLRKK